MCSSDLLLRNKSGKQEEAEEILKGLKFDNYTVKFVSKLVGAWDYDYVAEEKSVRKGIAWIGEEIFPLLLELKRANCVFEGKGMEEIDRVLEIYQQIYDRGDCLTIKSLAVTGKDLIANGIKPGELMGQILNQLLNEVLEEPKRNTKEYLLKRGIELEKVM